MARSANLGMNVSRLSNGGLSIGQCATMACVLEATAPKPGNVHRGADFDDLTFFDFSASAVAIAPALEAAATNGVGPTVLSAVKATFRIVATNTNLGTILLLAPLGVVPRGVSLAEGLPDVLNGLTAEDARCVYEAIRLANPAGLGQVSAMDIHDNIPGDLMAAMCLAADHDMVARQYAREFFEVLHVVLPWIQIGLKRGWKLSDAIVHTHVRMMSQFPDSLITRKCGDDIGIQAASRAQRVVDAGVPNEENYLQALADFDFWLRSDGHRRNPGTTADLIAAGLFVGIREGVIGPPFE